MKKRRASHLSSIRELDIDLRKLVNKMEQAENTIIPEESKNLKLQYAHNETPHHSKTLTEQDI